MKELIRRAFHAAIIVIAVLASTGAEQAAAHSTDACPTADVEDHLQALRGLDLLEVGDFLAVEAEASPYCYNLPCPEQLEAAEAATCERSATLATIRQDTEDL